MLWDQGTYETEKFRDAVTLHGARAETWKTAPIHDEGALVLAAAREQGLAGVLARRGAAPLGPPLFIPT